MWKIILSALLWLIPLTALGDDILGHTPHRPRKTRTPTPSPTITNTPTVTNTPTATPTGSLAPTNTPTPTSTPTRTPTSIPTPTVVPTASPSVPLYSQYLSNMSTYGTQSCTRIQNATGFDVDGNPNGLNDVYYDAQWVFFQIADTLGNPSYWNGCALGANTIYGHRYVEKFSGHVPGYEAFSQGFAENWIRISPQDSVSAKANYDKLLANGAFINASGYNDTYQGGCGAWFAIRETAYAMQVHLKASSFGETVNTARTTQLKGYLFTALDQTWSGAPSCAAPEDSPSTKVPMYRKPFMTALAAQALIMKWDSGDHDPLIVTKLANAGEVMWNTMRYAGPPDYPACMATFMYTNTDTVPDQGTYATPDLNLLINPFFYWLYKQTGDSKWLTRGDTLFDCGVRIHLNIQSSKQYNQNYRWSLQGLRWRAGL